MAQCVKFQPFADAASGVVVPELLTAVAESPCTGFVLLTPAEYGALSQNPFILSPEDATLVCGAIALTWVTAWAIRQAARALNSDGVQQE